jgi:hypothetical protein
VDCRSSLTSIVLRCVSTGLLGSIPAESHRASP